MWDIVDDDHDEQEILQVDGGENEPYHSEMDMDTGMDSCAPEKVRYHVGSSTHWCDRVKDHGKECFTEHSKKVENE